MTLQHGIERNLREKVPEVTQVFSAVRKPQITSSKLQTRKKIPRGKSQ